MLQTGIWLSRIEWGGELLLSWDQGAIKRIKSSAPQRIDKDTNAPQWITPPYFTTVGIVRNRADRALLGYFNRIPSKGEYRRKRPMSLEDNCL